MIPKHTNRPADPRSLARCRCERLVYCPRHHAAAYARFGATHRGESVEVAA
jgi:hypothetical protein